MTTHSEEQIRQYNSGKASIRQWTASGIGNNGTSLGMWSFGSVLGWSSPSVSQLETGNYIENLSKGEIAWAASIVMLAALPGCLLGGYLSDKFGRRKVCLSCVLPTIAGWTIIALAQYGWMLILGRFIVGLVGGIWTVAVAVYSAEIAEDRLRSKLASWNVVCLCLGILYTFIVGAIATWQWNSFASCLAPVLMLLTGLRFLPESHRYLIVNGDVEEAKKSLKWLRGVTSDDQVTAELSKTIQDVEEKKSSQNTQQITWDAATVKPVMIAVSAGVFCQLSGTTAVTLYTKNIFESSGSDFDPSLSAIFVCAAQAAATACAGLLMTKFGRRPLFIFSELGMGLSLFVLGLFYYLKDSKADIVTSIQWLPLLSLVSFTLTYCAGAGILPWALMADLCPPHVKGPASALCSGTTCLLGFLVGLFFPTLVDSLHSFGTFWLFAGINLVGAIYMYFILPETKDKTMDEILRMFRK